MRNILVLGGTTEASELAQALAQRGETAILSYAGRVASPRVQPVPVRTGGFGGIDGLAGYLKEHSVTHLVDATHPFAARMSANAVGAAARAGVPLIALTRPAWAATEGDRWVGVPDIDAAVAALAGTPQRVFLALGRMHLQAFARQPQHHYILRIVDPPETALPFPHFSVVVARGPFDVAGDIALMIAHRVDRLVAKNAGGSGANAKLDAARALSLPIVMIDRPVIPDRSQVGSVQDVLDWLDHSGTERGV